MEILMVAMIVIVSAIASLWPSEVVFGNWWCGIPVWFATAMGFFACVAVLAYVATVIERRRVSTATKP
jgi:hypothetical protein